MVICVLWLIDPPHNFVKFMCVELFTIFLYYPSDVWKVSSNTPFHSWYWEFLSSLMHVVSPFLPLSLWVSLPRGLLLIFKITRFLRIDFLHYFSVFNFISFRSHLYNFLFLLIWALFCSFFSRLRWKLRFDSRCFLFPTVSI